MTPGRYRHSIGGATTGGATTGAGPVPRAVAAGNTRFVIHQLHSPAVPATAPATWIPITRNVFALCPRIAIWKKFHPIPRR